MTSLPEPPGHLLTVAEYAALGEDGPYRWELQEGNLVMSPSPTPRHMIAFGELRDQLKLQLPRTCVRSRTSTSICSSPPPTTPACLADRI